MPFKEASKQAFPGRLWEMLLGRVCSDKEEGKGREKPSFVPRVIVP